MPIRLESHTGVLIKKAARLFEQLANSYLEKIGITHTQSIFLVRLWGKEGQTQMELATSSGLKQPTVVRILDRMEREQLIKRVRNQQDRRAYNFFLTDKARKACAKLDEIADATNKIAIKGFSKQSAKLINDYLLKIINNLQAS